jgi:hypothetical protein
VAAQMRHADPSTTLRVYSHVMQHRRKGVAERLDLAIWGDAEAPVVSPGPMGACTASPFAAVCGRGVDPVLTCGSRGTRPGPYRTSRVTADFTKPVVLLVLLAAFGAVLGAPTAARDFGVQRNKWAFTDIALVTAGWECSRQGYDVLVNNPCDRFEPRPMNYPRVWLVGAPLGLGAGATTPLAIVLLVGFVASLWFLLGRPSTREALFWIVLLCSPPVLLALERANNDLLIFTLFTVAIGLTARSRVHGGTAVIGIAAVLKLYPVVAGGVLLRRDGHKWLQAFGVLVLGFAVYVMATRRDLALISAGTPNGIAYSFGAGALLDGVSSDKGGVLPEIPIVQGGTVYIATWALIGVFVITGSVALWRVVRPELEYTAAVGWRADGLLIASAVLSTTYLLGYNYDYRLIFTLLAVPQLLVLARSTGAARSVARLALAGLAATLWASRSVGRSTLPAQFPLDEIANIVLQVLLGWNALMLLETRLRRSPTC